MQTKPELLFFEPQSSRALCRLGAADDSVALATPTRKLWKAKREALFRFFAALLLPLSAVLALFDSGRLFKLVMLLLFVGLPLVGAVMMGKEHPVMSFLAVMFALGMLKDCLR